MKNKDIYTIKQILYKWSNVKGEISYIILKNIELVDILINTFNKFKVIDITDYNLQKIEICNRYSNEIKDGKYIINDEINFNKEMDELDYNFIKMIEILNKDCNIKFYKIKKDHLPKNLSANDLKEISFMIE